jgi:hypothetical protein
MATFRCLLFVYAAVADALQQPAQLAAVGKVDDFRAVSSKMDELHAGIAKIKADSMSAVSTRKVELDSKLEELLARSRNVENINVGLAADVANLQRSNLRLRNQSSQLADECRHITADLQAMQLNITMAQEFIARSVSSSNFSLHSSPELQILNELDSKDAAKESEQNHEKHLSALGDLASAGIATNGDLAGWTNGVVMLQQSAAEKSPGTQDLLNELLSSYVSMSGQQSTSLTSLEEAFEKERVKNDQQYSTLLEEQTQLNATKHLEQAINLKLRDALAHLTASRDHLASEKVAVQRFATRLEHKPIQGADAPPPVSLSIPRAAAAASTPDLKKRAAGLLEAASRLKSSLR